MALLEKFWLISPDNTEQINVNIKNVKINKWKNEWEEKENPQLILFHKEWSELRALHY